MNDLDAEVRKQFVRIPDTQPPIWKYRGMQWSTEQAEVVIRLIIECKTKTVHTVYQSDDSNCRYCGDYGHAGGCPKCGTTAMGG